MAILQLAPCQCSVHRTLYELCRLSPHRPPWPDRWHSQCPHCGYEAATLQVSINVPQAHMSIDEEAREASLKALRQANFAEIVDHARIYAPPGGRRLLDVGSTHGWLLEAATPTFDVLGIEPDAAIGSKAALRGIPVRQGYFPDALDARERFDVIVFNDVIEHIPDIGSALCACHERLDPGGTLILNLPNSRGFFYRLSKLLVRPRIAGPVRKDVAKKPALAASALFRQ